MSKKAKVLFHGQKHTVDETEHYRRISEDEEESWINYGKEELLEELEECLEDYPFSFEVIESSNSDDFLDTLRSEVEGLVDAGWRDSEGTKFFFNLSKLSNTDVISLIADYVRENRPKGKPSERHSFTIYEKLRKLL
jgi:sarcosine oxidase delta subunit